MMPYRLIPRRMRDRLGRRGLVLLLFGLAWIVQGSAFFLLAGVFAEQPAYFLIDRLPLWLQGSAWIASGVLSAVAGVLPRREDDTFGFLAVSAMPMLLGASYLVGTVTYALDGSPLWMLGLFAFLVWAPVIVALGVIASWPEPPILGGDSE